MTCATDVQIPRRKTCRILRAEERANVDALVRAKVVKDIAICNVWNLRDSALRIRGVIVGGACISFARADDVDLAVGVLEAEEATGDDRNGILLVIDADKVRDFGIEEAGPCWVANTGSAVRHRLDVDARREVERKEHGVELSECASQGVTNLQYMVRKAFA